MNKITFALLTLTTCCFVSAQDFKSYVQMAKENNPEIQSTLANIQSKEYMARGAYAGFFPQLSADFSSSYRQPSTLSRDTSYQANLNLTQNFFRGGQDLFLSKQRKLELSLEQNNMQSTLVALSFDFNQALADFNFAHQSTFQTKANIDRRKNNLSLITLQYQGGRESKAAVELAKAYLAQAEYESFQAENTLRVSRYLLARILGVNEDQVKMPQHEIEKRSTQELPTDWIGTHPKMIQTQTQAQLAELQIKQSEARFLPSLDLSFLVGANEESFFPTKDFLSLSFLLSVPLFRGGQNYYARKSALAIYRGQNFVVANLKNQLKFEVEAAKRELSEASLKLKVDNAFISATILRAQIARVKYQNGLIGFDNWDIIENDLINRQNNVLQSKRNLWIKEAALLKSSGRHVFE